MVEITEVTEKNKRKFFSNFTLSSLVSSEMAKHDMQQKSSVGFKPSCLYKDKVA